MLLDGPESLYRSGAANTFVRYYYNIDDCRAFPNLLVLTIFSSPVMHNQAGVKIIKNKNYGNGILNQ
jgi:hypothetical protein